MHELKPHELRLQEEADELSVRMSKLAGFYKTPTFRALPEMERSLLYQQLHAMTDLSRILDVRIAIQSRFSPSINNVATETQEAFDKKINAIL